MRVLVVAGGYALTLRLRVALPKNEYKIDFVETGVEALSMLKHYEFDVVLLSLILPDMDGGDVIRQLRVGRIETPILALSPSTYVQSRVTALAAGADDVVVLPLDVTELTARMKAIVRRTRGYSQPILQLGAVSLSLETQEVSVRETPVHLTNKETAVLQLLMLRRNSVLTKDVFLNQLYGNSSEGPGSKIIDVFICKIRKKLEAAGAPNVIGTVWGRGYVMREDGPNLYPQMLPAPAPVKTGMGQLVA